jgi:hypothetical protein
LKASHFRKSFQNEPWPWYHLGPFRKGHFKCICVYNTEGGCGKKNLFGWHGWLVELDIVQGHTYSNREHGTDTWQYFCLLHSLQKVLLSQHWVIRVASRQDHKLLWPSLQTSFLFCIRIMKLGHLSVCIIHDTILSW